MKKKIWIPIVVAVMLLVVLFTPIPQESYDDGGTREYKALTYKIVHWNRIGNNGTYKKTCVYFGKDRLKSIDELWDMEYENTEHSFIGTVLEIKGDSVLIEPVDGEKELNSSDKFSFNTKDMNIGAKAGDTVKVTYIGDIMESYPAKINVTSWEISKDYRHLEYNSEWINNATAQKREGQQSSDLIITEIYADCFFATYVTPMPYTVKVNGTISKKWCVGDQVLVTYNNCYTDNNYRMECDLQKIEESDFEPDPFVCYKPVIYLYPEQETEISVRLDLDGKLTCTYPSYEDGWKVTATPDGILTDENGQTYNYLYWEGDIHTNWDMSKGFCVKGEDTAIFLENALAKLGLNRREANEFIVYWLPLMQENEYNIISFQTDVYTDSAKLNIAPNPDTLIRVFMTYKACNEAMNIEAQELTSPERTGFTVIEWGGSEIK